MAKGGIKVGDEVAITATVRKRVSEDRVSVLIPSYDQPHSIVDTTPHISSGQTIELRGEVTRVDDGTVMVGGTDLGIAVKANTVRLVTSHGPPTRRPKPTGHLPSNLVVRPFPRMVRPNPASPAPGFPNGVSGNGCSWAATDRGTHCGRTRCRLRYV